MTNAMKDYYKILGVREKASEEEVRARWVKLMRMLHPDRVGGEGSNKERIREINEAYEILKHSSTRMKYDLTRAYDQRRRRSRILKFVLPISLVIVPVAILSSIYLYVKMDPVASLLKWTTQNETNPTNPTNPTNQTNQRNEINQRNDVRAISNTRAPGPETSVKAEKMVPKEVDEGPTREVKKGVPHQMVKVAPAPVKPVPVLPSPSAPSSPARGEETSSKEKLSPQTTSKPEMPVAAEKADSKDSTAFRPHETGDPEPPGRTDPVGTGVPIDSKTEFIQQRIDPIDSKIPSKQETQRPDGTGDRISAKSFLAEEAEVRQFFAKYVDRYIQKDLEGFLSFFSSKAVQNQKEGFNEIRKIYAGFFNQTRQIQYQLEDLRIDLLQNGVEVKARYEIGQILKKKGEKKVWRGPIRWTLVKEEGALKILSLDYLHQ